MNDALEKQLLTLSHTTTIADENFSQQVLEALPSKKRQRTLQILLCTSIAIFGCGSALWLAQDFIKFGFYSGFMGYGVAISLIYILFFETEYPFYDA